MKTRVLLLVTLLGGFVLPIAPAQEVTQRTQPAANQSTRTPTTADAQAEEIEIMRRLLARAVTATQPSWKTVQLGVPTNVTNYLLSDYDAAGHPDRVLFTNPTYPNVMHENVSQDLARLTNADRLSNTIWGIELRDGTPANRYQAVQYWDAKTGKRLPSGFNHVWDVHGVVPETSGPQGVYLKGHGVVYTATVPLATAPADAKKPAPKALTEWERTRRELRGEKVEPTQPAAPQEALTDAVLKVLAENGGHFAHLGENEQITVALTLTPLRNQGCTQCHANTFDTPKGSGSSSMGGSGMGSMAGGSDPTSSRLKAATVLGEAVDTVAKETTDKVNGIKKDAQKAALLGDLHQKQGKNEQAAVSYEEALKLYLDALQLLRRTGLDVTGLPESDKQLDYDAGLTMTKLLQVYTVLGKTEDVRRIQKAFDAFMQKVKPAEKTTAAPVAASSAVELPAKLVISAPKKLLDLAGAGKVTAEEFRKAATVEYQPARTIDKAPAKPTGGE